ncbi:MAG: single-stranded-DNA-specific exonuclease RecJ [Alphaproteobacteria bacterium]
MVKEEQIVDSSKTASKKRWILRRGDNGLAQDLERGFALNPVTANILSARGFSIDDMPTFLDPKLASSLPDPFVMADMKKFSVAITKLILNGEPIGIIGDYDVDGATSTALLLRFLKAIKIRHTHYIPDRIDEGYGPSPAAFEHFKQHNIKHIIAVDCGTTAFEILEEAANDGFFIHILDHHEPALSLPVCESIVNPRRFDDQSGLGHLAAVGVVFMGLVAINRNLREVGYYKSNKITEPQLMEQLDLVALGTVCDVVPLTGLNRAFVSQGLKVMKRRGNIGLKHLCDISGLNEAPQAWHLGFMLGPRINAGGRVGKSDHGARLLSTLNENEAKKLTQELDSFNKQRQSIEQDILEEAKIQLNQIKTPQSAIIIGDSQWHSGVVGIIASRIKEQYYKPCLVWCSDNEGNYVGSGRSIPGVDLGSIILSAVESGVLIRGGGHSQAAGFTVLPSKLDEFKEFINKRVSQYIKNNDIIPELHLDALISPEAARVSLMEDLEKLAPFGMANPQPKFVIKVDKLNIVTPVGVDKQHLRCIIDVKGSPNITAMAFRVAGTELEQTLLQAKGKAVSLVGVLKINQWNGITAPQIIIEDAAIL